MNYKCRKCNSTKVITQKHSTDKTKVGLYCGKCGSWIKWLGKQEQQQLRVPQNATSSNVTTSKATLSKNTKTTHSAVLKLIKDLHTLANKSKIFKNTGYRYIMTDDLLTILGDFTFKNNINFRK